MGGGLTVALATCRQLPEADPDEHLLVDALHDLGVRAGVVAWNGPDDVAWGSYDLVVLRSTWDYHEPGNLPSFLQWATWIDEGHRLANAPAVVRWNTDKGYLIQLADAGLDVVPTRELGEPGALGGFGDSVVIKPRVSAGSRNTHWVSLRPGANQLPGLHDEPMLVQPYLASVEEHGERCLVYIDGEFTHAVRKQPRFTGEHEAVSSALDASPAERALADEVLGWVRQHVPGGDDLLYARVDMTPDEHGTPLLMELELVEP